MKVVNLRYSSMVPEQYVMDLAYLFGYRGTDLQEAIDNFITPNFKGHVAPWMCSAIFYRNDPDFSLVEKYKATIQAEHTAFEIPDPPST